jgi:glutamate racemase
MDNRPIGVFDSGLGGLTVVKELMKELPGESITYFGDTGRVPYGTRSKGIITKYATQDINFLISRNVKAIVVACGTVSSVALSFLREKFSLPIIGVVDATAKAAAAVTVNKKVGILGTSGTIASGAYERKLKELDEKIETVPRECPLFVPLVENGHINCIETYHIACNYLQPLKDKEVDTIILGCTHYPLLKEVIADIMGSDTKLVDSAAPTCGHVSRLLDEKDMRSGSGHAEYRYFVSDSADSFSKLGSVFLQKEITGSVSQIEIEQY